MAKTSGQFELEFIQSAKEKTGKSLEQWLSLVKQKGLARQMEILNWLKKEHGLNHMQAAFVAGIFLNDCKPVYQSESNLLDNQLVKAEGMRSLFGQVSTAILKEFPDATMIAKKTYVSFTASREFAAINIKPKELRLGFDLGDMATNAVLQKSKLTGPMPRISHMVIITQKDQLNKKVFDYLKQSFGRTHKK